MESENDLLLHIKKCKIYENSDNITKSKLFLNEKINYPNILLKKKNEKIKSTGKKKRKRKGNKKKKGNSVSKYNIALDLYQKQLKKNYKTLSSKKNRSKSPTEIEMIEDKYNILKNKPNSLNSLLPKTLSESFEKPKTQPSPTFIPVLSKRNDIQDFYNNSTSIQNSSSHSNSSILSKQLNIKNNSKSLSSLNLSFQYKNSKFDFQKLSKKKLYDNEKYRSINYSKILKYISDNNFNRNYNNININNDDHNIIGENDHTELTVRNNEDNYNSGKLEEKSKNNSAVSFDLDKYNSRSISINEINEIKSTVSKEKKENRENKENKENKESKNKNEEDKKNNTKKRNTDKYSSSIIPNLEKQTIKMKSFHRNFYSKLNNFTKSDVLYQYNNMTYKPLLEDENRINNNYMKKTKILSSEPLSSIKIGSNVYYHSINSLNSDKDNKYKSKELLDKKNLNLKATYEFHNNFEKNESNEKENINDMEEFKKDRYK
ncbi:hypothetical protein BCR32DRAFT_269587 [Anaeromyces robustus]|uniref:Uncharacterized protein n=1 Tax=Anaeromyces robustus TaxID=1754192 RepID=A0A1Y1X080_9FUNG|nr:hypothetical protein BCR32DRAFT_269587 [Anaeromyces robustus]|eukprot:ORX79239.1 hypothetical protein BCR32DRAFT_269587 [Anaeromyces robustus]